MNIIVDAMGGDNAPREIVRGAIDAAEHYRVGMTLVGNKSAIERCAVEYGKSLRRIEIVHSDTVLTMNDDPISVVRTKKDCSMAIGLKMLKNGGDALVSAGNTGALVAGATLIVRKIKGIRRASIGTVLPFSPPFLLLDSGANLEITPEDAVQFALIGGVYVEKMLGRRFPRVGLLNNGAEAT